jgi:transposase
VYWKPIWHVLESQFTLVLANALQIRSVPGRKSDVNDAMWIADLLAHGLIRGSFVPPAPIHELRDLTRTRKQLVRESAQHTLRIQKVLEDANLKLTSVISDVLGMSGRAMIEAIIAGERDPERLADLSQGRLKASRPAVVAALHGRVTPHHCFLLRLHLTQIDALEEAVRKVEARLGEAIVPLQAAVDRLMTIPAVRHTVARVIVAEIGVDMSRFPTAGHLISWAGLCPRLDESAGKRRSTRTRPGAPWLKTALVQAAWVAARTRNTYLRAQFLRLKSRRGPKKAILAVAASMLTAAYFYEDCRCQVRSFLACPGLLRSHRDTPPLRPPRRFRERATRAASDLTSAATTCTRSGDRRQSWRLRVRGADGSRATSIRAGGDAPDTRDSFVKPGSERPFYTAVHR